jgi:hypothetical protein
LLGASPSPVVDATMTTVRAASSPAAAQSFSGASDAACPRSRASRCKPSAMLFAAPV